MGILDSVFGGGQPQEGQDQGVRPASWGDRFRAEYAPGAYAAQQQNLQQQAIYSAVLQHTQNPDVARALAMSPQFFAAQQASYLPQPTQVIPVQNSDSSQTLVQQSNPGGGPGHGVSISGIPITEPPGTTGSPARAAGGASQASAAQGAQGGSSTPTAQVQVAQPTNTLEGMPGSTNAVLKQIEANRAAGKDPTEGIPAYFKGMAQAVMEGRETLKDITSTRGAQTRNAINAIIQAAEPEFDENMNEARNTYRKQYVSGKATDIGGQVKSLNKLAGHANAMAQAAMDVDNIGLGGSGMARPLNALGNFLYSTPAAGLKRAADLYTNELSSYVSGKGGSGVDERKQRSEAFSPNATPQEMGQNLLTDIEFLEKQMEGNEQHRNMVFNNPKMQEQFPLVSPEARAQLNEAKVKAHKLVGDFNEWSVTPEGQKATGHPLAQGLPKGWKLIQ